MFATMKRSAVVASMVAALFFVAPLSARQSAQHWVGTWGTAQVGRPQNPPAPPAPPSGQPAPVAPPAPQPFAHFSNQTLRQIAHVSLGGSRFRVVLSNTFGNTPLAVGAVSMSLREKDSTVVADSTRPLTFGGRTAFTIPAGAIWISDAVSLTVPAMSDVAVDVFLPGDTNTSSPLTMHPSALQTNYVSQPGNHAGETPFPVARTIQNSFLLARIDVEAPSSVGTIVPYGDSITDGSRSTPDTNNRWPDHLARRLAAANGAMGIVNGGIGGNRVLSDAAYSSGVNMVARFTRDVLDQPGVRYVIVLEGINDIGASRDTPSPSADDLIAAYKQLIQRAHDRGVLIYGATLTPYEGANYYSELGESKRKAVNEWIRTGGGFDAVIDFDAATRDPDHPGRFLPAYDSGDHLHPSDAGYKAMGEAIDLALFTAKPQLPRVMGADIYCTLAGKGAMGVGWQEERVGAFYRCLPTFDENLKPNGATWVRVQQDGTVGQNPFIK